MNVWIFFYIITNIEKNNKWEKIYSNISLYFIQYRRRKSRIKININVIHNVSRRIFDNEDDYLIFIWYKCNWFFFDFILL